MLEKRKLTPLKIGVYLIIFFTIWSIRELVVQPIFLTPLDAFASEVIGEIIKLTVWTLPAILLIRHFQDDMWIGLNEMFTTKPKWFKDAPILLVVFAPVLSAFLRQGGLYIDPEFVPARLIGAVLLVGITEEIVFRGFLLNALLKKMKLYPAIAINEVLFVLIHFPIWIYHGRELSGFLSGLPAVFILGVLFSYSFIKTKNIFVPIALHMIWNLLSMPFIN
jgi:membrane protease YdiL (CAAX protease family)